MIHFCFNHSSLFYYKSTISINKYFFFLFFSSFDTQKNKTNNSGTRLNHNNIPDVALNQNIRISPSHKLFPLNTQPMRTSTPIEQDIEQPTPTTSSTNAIATNPKQSSLHGRNGINLNRGIGMLRNAFFGNSGGSENSNNGGTCDTKDYKLLNNSIFSQTSEQNTTGTQPFNKQQKLRKC